MSGFTTTPNLGLFKPTFNDDDGLWAGHLNANADKLDAFFGTAAAGPYLPLRGGTLTGPITLNSTDPNARLVVANSVHGTPLNIVTAGDFGDITVKAFAVRYPFLQFVPLQANNIIAATRLTSDGLAPTSFVYDATVPRTAGNTLNFPINSACDFEARVVMRSTTGQAVCWTSTWGAIMGATAATTAMIGAPTWAVNWATAGALAAIGISPPSADTVNGGINLTVTPISLTWSGGGAVRMTKSLRV